jgi:hypothetical protein
MSTQSAPLVKRTAKPSVAGILNIVAGAGCVLGAFGMGVASAIFGTWSGFPFFGVLFGFLAIPAAILGVLAIIGGVFALQRRRWGWALVGSIAGILVSHVIGIISVVLIALSKDEFKA